MTHVCPQCKRRLPWDAAHFHREPRQRLGLSCTCKRCKNHRTIADHKATFRFYKSPEGVLIRGALYGYACSLWGRLKGDTNDRNRTWEALSALLRARRLTLPLDEFKGGVAGA